MRFLLTAVFVYCGLFHVLVDASCPDGYCRHSGGCYLVIGLIATWLDARDYCAILGGSLLTIKSSSEQTTARGVLERSLGIYPGKFWLDINDLLNPNDWKYTTSRTSISYSNWDDTVTNETTAGNCVSLSRKDDYFWSPTDCGQKMNFVCYASGITVKQYDRYSRYYYEYVDDETDDIPC